MPSMPLTTVIPTLSYNLEDHSFITHYIPENFNKFAVAMTARA